MVDMSLFVHITKLAYISSSVGKKQETWTKGLESEMMTVKEEIWAVFYCTILNCVPYKNIYFKYKALVQSVQ